MRKNLLNLIIFCFLLSFFLTCGSGGNGGGDDSVSGPDGVDPGNPGNPGIAVNDELIYVTGFENVASGEGFAAGSTYNSDTLVPPTLVGPEGLKWQTYHGTPSTDNPIDGLQSMQMRYYTSTTAPSHLGHLGYTATTVGLPNVTKVTFKAKYRVTSGTGGPIKVEVSYSTNGSLSWTSPQVFALSTSVADITYNVSATGEFDNVRIKFEVADESLPSQNTGTVGLYIDDVKIYGVK